MNSTLKVGVLILANASSVIISRWAVPWLIGRYGGVHAAGNVATCQSIGATGAVPRSIGTLGTVLRGITGYFRNGNDGPNDEPDPGLGQEQLLEDPNEENEEDEGQNV